MQRAYKLAANSYIVRDDGRFIPADTANVDYAEYLAWLTDGNTPAPADPVPQQVISVTPWQIRAAINQIGLRSAIETTVSLSDQSVKDGWEFAQEFRSDNALIAAVAQELGKTDVDVLALFALAKSLTL